MTLGTLTAGTTALLDGPLDGFDSGAAALGAASDVSLCSVVALAAARICSAKLGPADRRAVTSAGPPSGCAIDDIGSVAAGAPSPWATSAGATTAVVVSVAAAMTPPATGDTEPTNRASIDAEPPMVASLDAPAAAAMNGAVRKRSLNCAKRSCPTRHLEHSSRCRSR